MGLLDSESLEVVLSNTEDFEVVADECSDVVLSVKGSCVIEVRPKADDNKAYSATLTINNHNTPSSNLSGEGLNFFGLGVLFGGGIFAGYFTDNGDDYMIISMPGGCDGTADNPVCEGVDGAAVMMTWADAIGVVTGASSLTNGTLNTSLIVNSAHNETPAATYCDSMIFGGQADWYFPAREELRLLYDHREAIGGFADDFYLSSTEYNGSTPENHYRGVNFGNGANTILSKINPAYTRCVRQVPVP